MKRKDIGLIVAVVIVAGFLSLIISNVFFVPTSDNKLTAETVDPITTDFNTPDEQFFNPQSINPTQLIKIGESTNPNPF